MVVNGKELAITRIDKSKDNEGWDYNMRFRVYSRNEFHYSFESTKCLYHGIDEERAPRDGTEIVVKDRVVTIIRGAFYRYRSLSQITLPNTTITRILSIASEGCISLRFIRLPPNLGRIGYAAFNTCSSLAVIYIPPTVIEIAEWAWLLYIIEDLKYYRQCPTCWK